MNNSSHSLPITEKQASWAQEVDTVLQEQRSNASSGLDQSEVDKRIRQYGSNQLRSAKPRKLLSILIDQFKSVVILLLAGAGVLAFLFSDHIEGFAIFIVILINTAIGFITEWQAIRSMESLGRLGHVDTTVIRGGVAKRVSADNLVPGDIVLLEGGDVVTSDIRLIEAAELRCDESTLTGESTSVRKQIDSLPSDTRVMDQSNMAFKGTAITMGTGKGVVVQTGLNTELGKISQLVTSSEAHQTPLEIRLDKLGQRLAWAVLLMSILLAIAGLVAGRGVFLAFEVAIALAVAAIPEGLPIVATIALARGMWRMAKRKALISRLSAVETLGATSVILTDKTGTLTENRMTVMKVLLSDTDISLNETIPTTASQSLDQLFTIASLCNNASIGVDEAGKQCTVGDPTEVALLLAANDRNISRDNLLKRFPEIQEIAFNSYNKLMATIHHSDPGFIYAVKGAPEAVIRNCTFVKGQTGDAPLTDEDRKALLVRAYDMGANGLRTLAIAQKVSPSEHDEPYKDLILLGILGLEDPPRSGVKEAIQRCREAGIGVVMITGDHAATAQHIASELDMLDDETQPESFVNGKDFDALLAQTDPSILLKAKVVSRVTPEQKLALIDFYQNQDKVIAMTGDGVNDAPALKKADIGIAMGKRGTDVAKEASAMVLLDDDFASIVEAVAQGRAIFANIRKFMIYLLSCNISEVMIVSIATLAGAPLPLLPLQILFLNLVTDVFPALALGVGEGSPALMKQKPRPAKEPILTKTHWLRIVLHSTVISCSVFCAMLFAVFYFKLDIHQTLTYTFCTLAFAQLWHVFNMRDEISHPFKNEITANIWVWAAIALCIVLILLAVYVPLLSDVLKLSDPGLSGWLLILGMSLIPIACAPLVDFIARVFDK